MSIYGEIPGIFIYVFGEGGFEPLTPGNSGNNTDNTAPTATVSGYGVNYGSNYE